MKRLAYSSAVLAVVLDLLAIVLGSSTGTVSAADFALPLMLFVLALIGALVASHQPQNAIGWLFLGAAVLLGVDGACSGYASVALTGGRSIVGGVTAAWLSTWVFLPALIGVPPLLFLLFPDGRLLSRRWRPVLWLISVSVVLVMLSNAITPGPLTDSPVPGVQNPVGVSGPLHSFAQGVGWTGILGGLVLAAISTVLRYRRSRGRERLQMRWFVSSALLFFIVFIIDALTYTSRFAVAGQLLLFLAFVAIPTATGLAILRYRLYDIDLVINRTLVYAALTVALAAVYVTSVLVLRLALQPLTGRSDLAVAVSTLAVAALFRPLRARIQTAVDRRFYRRRYDASRTLATFTGRLRQEVDLETVSDDLRSVVRDTMHPAHLTLWLRREERQR